jgi:hypothetical protein
MWSEYSLDVIDAVARHGSFSGAAQELHRVPSAVSYTVRQLEQWLAVPLFVRRHRDVELTPAGQPVCQRSPRCDEKNARHPPSVPAGGQWLERPVAGGVDSIVKQPRCQQMVHGLLSALSRRGAARSVRGVQRCVGRPGGRPHRYRDRRHPRRAGGSQFAFRDMGFLHWLCVASPAASAGGHSTVCSVTINCGPTRRCAWTDTSRSLPKRDTWTLDNQRRMMVPDWASAWPA